MKSSLQKGNVEAGTQGWGGKTGKSVPGPNTNTCCRLREKGKGLMPGADPIGISEDGAIGSRSARTAGRGSDLAPVPLPLHPKGSHLPVALHVHPILCPPHLQGHCLCPSCVSSPLGSHYQELVPLSAAWHWAQPSPCQRGLPPPVLPPQQSLPALGITFLMEKIPVSFSLLGALLLLLLHRRGAVGGRPEEAEGH